MTELILKEELTKLMSLKGEVKGMGMKTHGEFVKKDKGEAAVKKIEEAMASLGYPLKFKEIKEMGYYPLGMEALVLILMQRLFNYSNEKFQEIGRFHIKLSLITKLFIQYFSSLKILEKQVPKIWERYFTIGSQKVVEWSEEKKYAIVRVENFVFHPLHCQILIGSLSALMEMILKKKVTVTEEKCIYRGDEYHEFLLKW